MEAEFGLVGVDQALQRSSGRREKNDQNGTDALGRRTYIRIKDASTGDERKTDDFYYSGSQIIREERTKPSGSGRAFVYQDDNVWSPVTGNMVAQHERTSDDSFTLLPLVDARSNVVAVLQASESSYTVKLRVACDPRHAVPGVILEREPAVVSQVSGRVVRQVLPG